MFPGQTIQYHRNQVDAPTTNAEKDEVGRSYEDLHEFLELTSRKDVLFNVGDWNPKVGSQEIPGVTGIEYKMKQGKD